MNKQYSESLEIPRIYVREYLCMYSLEDKGNIIDVIKQLQFIECILTFYSNLIR